MRSKLETPKVTKFSGANAFQYVTVYKISDEILTSKLSHFHFLHDFLFPRLYATFAESIFFHDGSYFVFMLIYGFLGYKTNAC